MRSLLVTFIMICVSLSAIAQCKTFRIGVKGDTLNCVDYNDLKQGRWVIKVESLRGNPGYEEEGIFKDDKKTGAWRLYNPMGDLMGQENYKFGYKNGVCKYYTLQGLEHTESWYAIDPHKVYDTIEVPDPIDDRQVALKVIKLEGTTVRHGEWKYYDPASGMLIRTETYVLDTLKAAKERVMDPEEDETDSATENKSKNTKPAAVLEYEKKNSGKKKIKVREGQTGY